MIVDNSCPYSVATRLVGRWPLVAVFPSIWFMYSGRDLVFTRLVGIYTGCGRGDVCGKTRFCYLPKERCGRGLKLKYPCELWEYRVAVWEYDPRGEGTARRLQVGQRRTEERSDYL